MKKRDHKITEAGTLPPMPRQYSARVVRSDGQWSMNYQDGRKDRIEVYNQTGLLHIIISRSDKGVIWMLDPNTMAYHQSKLSKGLEHAFSPEMLFDWVADGSEIIDRRRYQRFVGRLILKKGVLGEIFELCFLDMKTGMRRRFVTVPNGTKRKPSMVVDYLDVALGKPPRSLFELPNGYKRGKSCFRAGRGGPHPLDRKTQKLS
jgi:hypothetical protein